MSRRVAVTGIGIIAPTGDTTTAFWDALVMTRDSPVRAAVEGFEPGRWLERREVRRSTRFMQLAVAAAVNAHEDAGRPGVDPLRTGVVLGNAYGAPEALAKAELVMAKEGPAAVNPVLGMITCESASAASVAMKLGAQGHTKVVIGACAGGAMAIADAADLIRSGRCDLVYAGASQSLVTPAIEASYRNLRVVSTSGYTRPFDRRRDGFVFSEGAAVLVLEPWLEAEARGAHIYAELAGSANTDDAHHMIAPSGVGAAACMRMAIADAGLAPDAIRHVNAHGTGTDVNDVIEAHAIRDVLGPADGTDAVDPPYTVTSIKRVTGHSAAASGAFEAAAVCLSFRHGLVPSVAVDFEPDPDIPVPVVHGSALPWSPGPTVSNSIGLGGHNCSLVLLPPP